MVNNEQNTQINVDQKTLAQAARIAIQQDKPIMLDYWPDSYGETNVLIGVRQNDEKLLVRSAEEYTSPIAKIFKVDDVFIICTENSIYLTSAKIDKRRIST